MTPLSRVRSSMAEVGSAIGHHFRLWMLTVLTLPLLYYLLQLAGLILRFGELPNYFNHYQWVASVQWILESTPSWHDALKIIRDEWWLEIGFMNYDFGKGISEWALVVMPVQLLGHLLFASLLATLVVVFKARSRLCTRKALLPAGTMTGVGGTMAALSSISMSWVVCCSTPTWVVGLSMMGLGVTTSLWLEPLGVWLKLLSVLALLTALFMTTGEREPRPLRPAQLIRTLPEAS